MKLDFAFLANHAAVTPNGLFSVLEGGISTMEPPKLPTVCQTLFLITRMSFTDDERGKEFACVAKVNTPEGAPPFPISVLKGAPPAAKTQVVPTFTGIYGFENMVLVKPGIYQFRILVGDTELGGVDLEVKAPQPHS